MIDLALMDRLKVLNFDEEFRRDIKMRPMSRYYFLVEINPLEQFHVFTSLAVWLCHKCGLTELQPPLEDDDPNSTVSGILDAARSLGVPVDFSPNKLKQGFGEHVVYLLEKLSEKALKKMDHSWQALDVKPDNSDDDANGSGAVDDEDDDDDEDVEEFQGLPEEMEYSSGSDGENIATSGIMTDIKGDNFGGTSGSLQWDAGAEWRSEVERVAPSLRIRILPSARDWRAHGQQLATHRSELARQSTVVGEALSRAVSRAAAQLEACASRQVLLQDRTGSRLEKLASLSKQAVTANDSYKAVSGGVTQRQETLAELTEKVEAVRQKTEMKGSAMNDQSPVVNIRRAVAALRKEIQDMDTQLAVLMWSVIEHQSRAKRIAV